jgi:hypothetical protein
MAPPDAAGRNAMDDRLREPAIVIETIGSDRVIDELVFAS